MIYECTGIKEKEIEKRNDSISTGGKSLEKSRDNPGEQKVNAENGIG